MSTLALAALAFVLYTYIGYPVSLAILAKLRGRERLAAEPARAPYEPLVSVCIAVHDGAELLENKMASLLALDYPREKIEFLLCSDGSTDGTEELARRMAERDPRITVLASERRLGKPMAVNAMRQRARGEVMLMTDVRQPLASDAVRELLKPLADPDVGCVSGTLQLAGETGAGVYWRYERFIRGSEARLGNLLGVSGCLYAVRRQELVELPLDLLLDDMFVPLSVVHATKRVVLAERAFAYDDSCDDEREFARKVRTLAGNYQLLAKLPWLLIPGKNPLWLQLFSHKLFRLWCPFALLTLFVASGALAADARLSHHEALLWQSLWCAQVLFYALAWVGGRAGRLGALARTFVVLNAAAVVGLWRFARGSQAVTW